MHVTRGGKTWFGHRENTPEMANHIADNFGEFGEIALVWYSWNFDLVI